MGHCINTQRWLVSLTDIFLFGESALITTGDLHSLAKTQKVKECGRLMSALGTYTLSEREKFSIHKSLEVLIKVAGQAMREIRQKSRGESKEVTSSAK